MTDTYNTILLSLAFIPFILFVLIDTKINLKKEVRNKQFFMPIVALVVCIVLFIFMNKLGNTFVSFFFNIVDKLREWADKVKDIAFVGNIIKIVFEAVAKVIHDFLTKINLVYVVLVLFNTCSMFCYLIIKKFLLLIFVPRKHNTAITNKIVSIFYDYDERMDKWYIRNHFGQAKTMLKTAYYATTAISAIAVFISFYLCKRGLIQVPFYPIFPIILIGEVAFFVDGVEYDELENKFSAEVDNSRHVTNYVILRKKLKELFGDKLSSDGTTVNDGIVRGGSIDQILEEIEQEYGRTGQNYSLFIRNKAKTGLVPSADYVRSGIELTMGKSLLFNTPFYYKLNPYMFYAMHTALLKGGKVLIVLGRHGTKDDVMSWCENGLFEVTNLPSLWNIQQLDRTAQTCDIGIVTRSGVHDLELHKANREFLNEVSFVVLVEPSRLVTTAQIGLNLLVRNISVNNNAVYCSVDKNCDGLVDSLSHILMTNITEVSATEFPEGTSSHMCWTADSDYLQHRITPGISRYLGMGTEISFTALKNNVERAIWYGGDAYPVLDQHWIAKQYFHDLLGTTTLPATQETFDKYFKVSYNFCNEQVRENSFISVEDEFYNLFEVKREFTTMSKNQGFVNVISSDYMLRGYMTENEEVFIADPKAIPYISADYARTKRNTVLKICLQMSILGMFKEDIKKELLLIGADTNEVRLKETVWEKICEVYCKNGEDEIIVDTPAGRKTFNVDVITYKREFSIETGKFEDIFAINDTYFKQYVIDDLQSARYIAEKGNESTFLGTELKGHILQKYLPGQFITLNGKYYEMLSVTSDNQVIVRRASDHINGRYSYRQIRKYRLDSASDNSDMGMLRSLNGIKVYNQFANFSVDTPAYWRMNGYNDFENATKVAINNVPQRNYINKHILKLDFSDFKGAFTPEVRTTLTLLMNEAFRTMFAENQLYIVAVTAGEYERPFTYSLSGDAVEENCIYIIEDSQLDIGLLVSVERNFERIMQIISDYLAWNKSMFGEVEEAEEEVVVTEEAPEEPVEKNPIKRAFKKVKKAFGKIGSWFKGLFGKKNKTPEVPAQDYMMIYGKPHKKVKGKWVACSQEEFDAKMQNRHEAIEDKKEAEKAEKEAEKEAVEQSEQTAEETTVDTVEEKKPKKKGFFGSLFGKKNKKSKEDAEKTEETVSESPEEPAEEVTEDVVENTTEETAADTAEETAVETVEEKKPKKKGFFASLFGKKDKKSKKGEEAPVENTEEQTEENTEDIKTEEKEGDFDVSGV